ncbi:MAG: alcohol dehydrogenase catalytic domain-containing protein, partial [Pseudobutyrivibrio sp.]|nr:alcohol dehydrogenase catalytic domain-containing protein [Pseudobutyrivibrio sp.]
MKAYNLHGIGDFRFEEVDKPEIKSDVVLVKVKACGICGSDVPRVYKNGTYHFPTIIGHEFSGQVEETGSDVDPKWKGKSVGIFPLVPCMKCACCKDKKYEMCSDYNYLGSRTDGGFAEYVAVPEWNLMELPDAVTYEQAAMLEPMAVAVHAIRQSGALENVSKDASVVVAGLGTIGLLVVMFLKEAGFKNIMGVGNKDFQKKCFVELGFQEEQFCNVKNQSAADFILNRTDKAGCQVFFECVGNNETLNLGLQALAPGGFLQLVGNPAGDMNLS